jgi:hypothetical protein
MRQVPQISHGSGYVVRGDIDDRDWRSRHGDNTRSQRQYCGDSFSFGSALVSAEISENLLDAAAFVSGEAPIGIGRRHRIIGRVAVAYARRLRIEFKPASASRCHSASTFRLNSSITRWISLRLLQAEAQSGDLPNS